MEWEYEPMKVRRYTDHDTGFTAFINEHPWITLIGLFVVSGLLGALTR